MKPVTRVAAVSDAEDLARLNALFNGVETPAAVYAARLQAPGRVETPVLAELDGRVVGFAALRISPSFFYDTPHAEMTELFVEEGWRRRGVGRALLAQVEALARQAGAHGLVILTDYHNDAAQCFYRACGYCAGDVSLVRDFEA